MPKALITGIAGFAGSHLADLLLEKGWKVGGIDRGRMPAANVRRIAHRLDLYEVDILDHAALEKTISGFLPDAVFHLAGVAYVPHAQHNPTFVFDINATGTLNLLQACQKTAPAAKVVLISSSQVYGQVPSSRMPLRESSPARPANAYGLSKFCAEEAGLLYQREYGLPVVIVRPFNHIGPRQSPVFVVADWARQIARIEAGKQDPILQVGDLGSGRDFLDVRDMVEGYHLALEKGRTGSIYNICSGRALRVKALLAGLLKKTTRRIEVREEASRLRTDDINLLYGDCAKFRKQTGWKPRIRLEKSLQDILDYWREQERR
jgi:GDP-4-dehydro-6-deoxy-D-mannose reductase